MPAKTVSETFTMSKSAGSGRAASAARVSLGKSKCLFPGDASDRFVRLGRLLDVFRSPIHAEIDQADALVHARLIALDGVIAVGVEKNLHHQFLAGHQNAVGGSPDAAFPVFRPGRCGLGMLLGKMFEHHAPQTAEALSGSPRKAAHGVNRFGSISIWRHWFLL